MKIDAFQNFFAKNLGKLPRILAAAKNLGKLPRILADVGLNEPL